LSLTANNLPRCRLCNSPLKHTFADLGLQPLSENYLKPEQLNQMEPFYPLHVYFCENCFLVQLEESVTPQEIFNEYAYFSSSSKGWIKHIKAYAEMIIGKLGLSNNSQVVEIGSNDGCLLQFFAVKGISVLGVEPAINVAEEAIRKGIPTVVKFFGSETSKELKRQNKQADLLIGNNILAQVPDTNGFVEGLKTLLKPSGVITLEFHHLLNLMNDNQFDTISHERYSYFSFFVIEKVMASHGLTIFDVEEIPTHGGSLRIYARHADNISIPVTSRPERMREAEKAGGLIEVEKYLIFADKVKAIKRNILDFLIKAKRKNKSIVGYGAHAEAHTLLNYCGVDPDFLDYTVDRNPIKQGKFLAGIRIPIFHPDKISETKPDYVLILPWSIKKEIMNQTSHIGAWGGQFVVAIPTVKLFNSDGTEINNEISTEGEIK
jgi:2-polyprenyl-3-methyl-5-hydroxy-6-metoxy-1,4-benzoquinol methylase